MRVPPLETARLVVRPFAMKDLDAVHRVLDLESAEAGAAGAWTRRERAAWLRWTVRGYEQLARLYQPPYGERAITLRHTGEIVGACGLVPCLAPFDQIPALRDAGTAPAGGLPGAGAPARAVPEVGLFWAVAPAHRRRGYATEAAGALITYAFDHLDLARIVATTTHDNAASIGVMRRLGLRIERNPLPTPPWLQVVGVLWAPGDRPDAVYIGGEGQVSTGE